MSDRPEIQDVVALLASGAIGAVPIVGPLVAEAVKATIPNQRIDRIHKLVLAVEQQLKTLEYMRVSLLSQGSEQLDLLEDGFVYASRALTSKRIDSIAKVLANGLTAEEKEVSRYKQLLHLLNSITDSEYVRLHAYYKLENGEREEIDLIQADEEKYNLVDIRTSVEQDEKDAGVLAKYEKDKLSQLGLLRRKYKKPVSGKQPEFDVSTGMIKSGGYEISALGSLLVRHIGTM